MSTFIILFLFSWAGLVHGGTGYDLRGRVVDDETGDPLELVTVYLNGSTRGTITDKAGWFELRNVDLPCDLVLSHVSYETARLPVTDTTGAGSMLYRLHKRMIRLPEASVVQERLRKSYLERFRRTFLGAEFESQQAEILNEEVLSFIPLDQDGYEVYAAGPIEVLLPLSSYRIQVDLIHYSTVFSELFEGLQSSLQAGFFFEEIPVYTRSERRTVARHRMETYYGSRHHFCRSWYHHRLEENGYQLVEAPPENEINDQDGTTAFRYKQWFEAGPSGNRVLIMTQFSSRAYNLYYHHRSRNRPVDLTYLDPSPRSYRDFSRLLILEDTIRIMPSGRIVENSIMFGHDIGRKGVAWLLPDDYIPSMQ